MLIGVALVPAAGLGEPAPDIQQLITRAEQESYTNPEALNRDARSALAALHARPDADLEIRARLLLCARGSLGALDPEGSAVGFHVLAPLQKAGLVELTRSDSSSPVAAARAERFFEALGKHVSWVGDSPGLVLGRIVCQVINESAFALGEGIGAAEDIDTGMVLGLSHPRGPLAWADEIGLDHVLASDPDGVRPDSFYKIETATLYITRRF